MFYFILYYKWTHTSPYARTWDEVDFALAIERFDLLAMQPHFPGYPYFILGGMLLHSIINEPVGALSKFNVMMSALAVIPMYLMARSYFSKTVSMMIAICIQSMTYLWVVTTSPISEGAAISLLWWFVWSIQLSLKKGKLVYYLLSVFIFSLLLGTRLSFIPFGIGLVLLAVHDWKLGENNRVARITFVTLVAILFQLIWVLGLVLTEGSLAGFMNLSLSFIQGHFNDWGGAVTATSTPIWERFTTLLFYNIIQIGLLGASVITAAILALGTVMVILKNKKMHWDKFHMFLLIMIGVYFLWALLGQNIEKPRHISPLLGFILYLILHVVFTKLKKSIAIILVSSLLVIQTIEGIEIVNRQVEERPAVYQLIDYLDQIEEPFIIYTWEETRVMEYTDVSFEHKRLFTYELYKSDIEINKNKRILLTGRILKGFERQGVDLTGKVKRVKEFQSDPLFDPVYSAIVLYEWKK
jgi:hypothetical protein